MTLKEIPLIGEYALRYDWAGFEAMMEALEAPSFSDFDKGFSKLGPRSVRMMVWAGLLHKFPLLKKEEVAGIITSYLENNSLESLTAVLNKALLEGNILTSSAGEKTEGN